MHLCAHSSPQWPTFSVSKVLESALFSPSAGKSHAPLVRVSVWRKSFVKTDAQGNINVLETAKSHLALSNPLVGVMGLSSSVRVNWRPEPTAALPIRIPRRWFGQGGGSYDLQLPLRWAAFPLGWWPIDVPLAACWQDISRANGAPSATWRIEILPGSLLSTSSGSAVWGSNILDILLPQVCKRMGREGNCCLTYCASWLTPTPHIIHRPPTFAPPVILGRQCRSGATTGWLQSPYAASAASAECAPRSRFCRTLCTKRDCEARCGTRKVR